MRNNKRVIYSLILLGILCIVGAFLFASYGLALLGNGFWSLADYLYSPYDKTLEKIEKQEEGIRKNNLYLLRQYGNMDDEMAMKTLQVLGKVGVRNFKELRRIGEKYEFSDIMGSGYFILKNNVVDKVVLEDAILIENGKILYTPKMNEE